MAFSYTNLAFLLLICTAAAAPAVEATLTCGDVTKNLVGCLTYLKGGPGPSPGCCSGVQTLAGQAKTPGDRQTACGCLKSTAGSLKGLVLSNAAALPGKCKVSVPYPINPNVDCSKVH